MGNVETAKMNFSEVNVKPRLVSLSDRTTIENVLSNEEWVISSLSEKKVAVKEISKGLDSEVEPKPLKKKKAMKPNKETSSRTHKLVYNVKRLMSKLSAHEQKLINAFVSRFKLKAKKKRVKNEKRICASFWILCTKVMLRNVWSVFLGLETSIEGYKHKWKFPKIFSRDPIVLTSPDKLGFTVQYFLLNSVPASYCHIQSSFTTQL